MNTIKNICPLNVIASQVVAALNDDLAIGIDYTAGLIRHNHSIAAVIKTNEDMVMCGCEWVNMVFNICDPTVKVSWHALDGDVVKAGSILCEIIGNARAILTGERTALNFIQTLSATATIVREYVNKVSSTQVKIMDTRKTIPGLRLAQKYAVTVGGGYNQRIGLYDGVLIKENHIGACGGITSVLSQAFASIPKHIPIQIEVETFEQLTEALDSGAENILLDNMSLEEIKNCVTYTNGRAILEVSGNVNINNVLDYAYTGIDRISIGALTKHIKAIDLSMRIIP
jgi:nicotinate-nucleotide pyrophosphorylase (carboxylating)